MMEKQLLTMAAFLALLGSCVWPAQASSFPNGMKCFPWWNFCQGQYFCDSLSAFIQYQNTSTELCSFTIPQDLAPWPGECIYVPDPVSSESGSCQFVNPCAATLKSCFSVEYQCDFANSSVLPPQCSTSSPPPPTAPCSPANGSCEFFQGNCVKWQGFCNSGYQCGTAVDHYKFTHGPQAACVDKENAAPPIPPGECIYQTGQCVWSNCTSWLDHCQTYWTCGTNYDREVYFASPPPACAAPPFGSTPPPEPIGCQYNITAGQCEYITLPCEGVDCSVGSLCMVDPATNQPFCQPSCDIANGGCADDQICSLMNVECITSPCPPQVICSDPVPTCTDAASVVDSCPPGSYCVVDSATNQQYCQPSCDLSNGGCADDEECSLMSVLCETTPCPPLVTCTPIDNTTDPCATVLCQIGSYCVSDSATGFVYCKPSCSIANGGCADNENCTLVKTECVTGSCLPQVVCSAPAPPPTLTAPPPTLTVPPPTHADPCNTIDCTSNSRCVVENSASSMGTGLCLPSCYVGNGGCGDEVCIVEIDGSCTNNPCSSVTCVRAGDYRDGRCPAGMVYESCGSYCTSGLTCHTLGTDIVCPAVCVEGCFCPDGLVVYRDRCVDPLECPALLANPPPLSPLPLAENQLLIQLSIINTTVEMFKEVQFSFLESLQSILVSNGFPDAQVDLYAVMEDTASRSHSQILVVVKITSDVIANENIMAADITAIIDRNKDSLPLPVTSVSGVTSPYEGADDNSSSGVIVAIVIGSVAVAAIVVVITAIAVCIMLRKSHKKSEPYSLKYKSEKAVDNVYGNLEPELVSLEAKSYDDDDDELKKDLVH